MDRAAQLPVVTLPRLPRLRAFIICSALAGGEQTLADRTGLRLEETLLLRIEDHLPGSEEPHHLFIRLEDGEGDLLYESGEPVLKSYNGAPSFGIDKNTSFRWNGQLFHPVMPHGLYNAEVDDWPAAGFVNALTGQGYWGTSGPPAFTMAGFGETWTSPRQTGSASSARTPAGTEWALTPEALPTAPTWTGLTHSLDDTRTTITGFAGWMYSSCASSYRHT